LKTLSLASSTLQKKPEIRLGEAALTGVVDFGRTEFDWLRQFILLCEKIFDASQGDFRHWQFNRVLLEICSFL
jgi:hypothetical protein